MKMLTAAWLRPLLNNLLWFGVSLVLAFMVWFVATIQADPLEYGDPIRIPVQIDLPSGLTLTNNPTASASVTFYAQRSLLGSLSQEDIIVHAVLDQEDPGQYQLPLIVDVAGTESFSAETQPRQITVEVERIVTAQKTLTLNVTDPPALDFSYEEPEADILQVQVSGASSRVSAVSTVRGDIDISQSRTEFSGEIPLAAFDTNGRRLNNVTIEPSVAFVTVPVYQRDDVRQVAVIPDILFDTLPTGYFLASLSPSPSQIYVSGSPSELSILEDRGVRTAPIDLSGQTDDFEVVIPLELSDEVLPLSGERNVRVSVGLSAQTVAQQFDDITVEAVGLPADYTATFTPTAISVVLNGPINIINDLVAADVRVILNLAGAEPGTSERTPEITVRDGEITLQNPQLIPAVINVSIIAPTGTPETTPESTPAGRPTEQP